ncbi:serine/threonine-protein kinase DCLK3 [Saccopteryx bilineata]|uniref:serine/threonine-protein kinase DCLK3 n=1 Tax=Saccopteryx bilineata TaxID=59482 RepID=UPI00338D40F3
MPAAAPTPRPLLPPPPPPPAGPAPSCPARPAQGHRGLCDHSLKYLSSRIMERKLQGTWLPAGRGNLEKPLPGPRASMLPMFGPQNGLHCVHAEGSPLKPRVVTVVKPGGHPLRRITLLLNRRSVQTFEQLLADVSEALGFPRWKSDRVRKLFNLKGKEVRSVSEFFREGDAFIAVGKEPLTLKSIQVAMEELYPGKARALTWTQHSRLPSPSLRSRLCSKAPKGGLHGGGAETAKSCGEAAGPTAATGRQGKSPVGSAREGRAGAQKPWGRGSREPEPPSKPPREATLEKRASGERHLGVEIERTSGEIVRCEKCKRERELRESLQSERPPPGAGELDTGRGPLYAAAAAAGKLVRTRSCRRSPEAHPPGGEEERKGDGHRSSPRKPTQEPRRPSKSTDRKEDKDPAGQEGQPPGAAQAKKGVGEAQPVAQAKKGVGEAQPVAQAKKGVGEAQPVAQAKKGVGEAQPVAQAKKGVGEAQPVAQAKKGVGEAQPVREQGLRDGKKDSRNKQGGWFLREQHQADSGKPPQTAGEEQEAEKERSPGVSGGRKALPREDQPAKADKEPKARTEESQPEKAPGRKRRPAGIISAGVEKQYETGRVLGDGNFAVVKECRHRETGQAFAMKIVDKSKLKGKEDMVDSEIFIIQSLSHPNIVKLHEVYETDTEIYLIMEYVAGGDLFDAILENVKFPERTAARLFTDLCQALVHMHDKNIVHRDLKPENLLVQRNEDKSTTLKLADFGLAKHVVRPVFTVCGTPTYVAPEILSEKGYGLEADMWAAGVILYILLCGFPPFRSPERDQDELFNIIQQGHFEFLAPYWDNISDAAKDLVSRLLVVDPKKRYTAHQVLKHPWIESSGKTGPANLPKEVSPGGEGHLWSQRTWSAEQAS